MIHLTEFGWMGTISLFRQIIVVFIGAAQKPRDVLLSHQQQRLDYSHPTTFKSAAELRAAREYTHTQARNCAPETTRGPQRRKTLLLFLQCVWGRRAVWLGYVSALLEQYAATIITTTADTQRCRPRNRKIAAVHMIFTSTAAQSQAAERHK